MSDLDLDATAIESLCTRGLGAAPDSAAYARGSASAADKAFDAILKRITA